MKKLILLVGIFLISFAFAYTAPVYNDIDLVLDGTQTATDYTDINLVLGDVPTDSCTYTSGNWDVLCSDNCSITSNEDVDGNNITISGTGTFIINGANISNYDTLYLAGTDTNNICELFCRVFMPFL